jgi:hypothetical protein
MRIRYSTRIPKIKPTTIHAESRPSVGKGSEACENELVKVLVTVKGRVSVLVLRYAANEVVPFELVK